MTRRTAVKILCSGTALGLLAALEKQRILSVLGGSQIGEAERQAMAQLAEDFRRRFDAPGLSVAIARDGRMAYVQAFGTTSHDLAEPLTNSNLFRIASVSKPITSAAIFTLIESGRVGRQDTVFGEQGVLGTKYGRRPYGSGIEQITIDHLLTHTCGGWVNDADDPMFSNPGMDQDELISWTLDNQPLKNLPGMAYAYSNFGYCLLGRVIEKITGLPYSECIQKTILLPIGITDMRIAGNTLDDRAPGEVIYYGQAFGESGNYFDDPYSMNVTRMDSHSGWIANVSDLVQFASHVDGFNVRRNILKPETIRTMTTPSDVNPGYARGWSVDSIGNWWHAGNLAGTTSIVVRTSSRFCWAALTNTRRSGTVDALDNLIWAMARSVRAWRSALA